MQIRQNRYFNQVDGINDIYKDATDALLECYALETAMAREVTEELTEVILEAAGASNNTFKKWWDKAITFMRNMAKKVMRVAIKIIDYITKLTTTDYSDLINIFDKDGRKMKEVLSNHQVIARKDKALEAFKKTHDSIVRIAHMYSVFDMSHNKTTVTLLSEAILESGIENFEKQFEACAKANLGKGNDKEVKAALLKLLQEYSIGCRETLSVTSDRSMEAATNKMSRELDRMVDSKEKVEISNQVANDITKMTTSINKIIPVLNRTLVWATKQTDKLKITKED